MDKKIIILFITLTLSACSTNYTPLVDSKGKSSAKLNSSMNNYHDDLETCRAIADDNTNDFINGSKVVYNKMRWRVLWLSPELKTKKNIVNNCMKGRGYSILN